MIKKEMIAMLLAGGQGSRLGILTSKVAKPAVAFGGKYRIIDFPLSNCINSGVDTVGVLTQYQPLRLNTHIGIGIPWDLDRNIGGVTVLPPYEKIESTEWYTGTANAILQNIEYMDTYNPEYVLILSGDHIYKMDYEAMLDFHKANGAEVTIAVMPVPWEEASRFGIMITDEALLENADQPHLDFGKHVIPYCKAEDNPLYAYEFNGYWKDVGTLNSYWEANMELIDIVPEFNLYEEYWKIYTKSDALPPQYFSEDSEVERSIIGEGTEIYGKVYNSVIGCNVMIGAGTVVRDSIIMNDTKIGSGGELNKVIIAENVQIGDRVKMGFGEEKDNETDPHIYNHGLCTIGEKSVIPNDVTVGKNVCIGGVTTQEDYPDLYLPSGRTMIKAGE